MVEALADGAEEHLLVGHQAGQPHRVDADPARPLAPARPGHHLDAVRSAGHVAAAGGTPGRCRGARRCAGRCPTARRACRRGGAR